MTGQIHSGKASGIANAAWVLKGRVRPSGDVQYVRISKSPYRVGRRADLSLSLPFDTVSGLHAEFLLRNDQLVLKDLSSTNGTYVNGAPVKSELVLSDGDLIQMADVPFRVCRQNRESGRNATVANANVCDRAFTLVQFDRLMEKQDVVPYFQPIVTLPDQETIGYEVLGRSKLVGLETPKDMFLAASQLNLEAELSQMFRLEGIVKGTSIPQMPNLFLNTHPVEVVNCGLLDSLHEIRKIDPNQLITLEIHEAAVTDREQMAQLRAELDQLNMKLAYDDFGAGQSRLAELSAVRPDYLKFDMHMIRDIHLAPLHQRKMLKALVDIALDLGVIALAEGIESVEEHGECCEIGFQMAQGYFYGEPVPFRYFSEETPLSEIV